MTTKLAEWASGHRQPTKIELSGRLRRKNPFNDRVILGNIAMKTELLGIYRFNAQEMTVGPHVSGECRLSKLRRLSSFGRTQE